MKHHYEKNWALVTKQVFTSPLSGRDRQRKGNHCRRDSEPGNVLKTWREFKRTLKHQEGPWRAGVKFAQEGGDSYTKTLGASGPGQGARLRGAGPWWEESSVGKPCGDEGPDLCRIRKGDRRESVLLFYVHVTVWKYGIQHSSAFSVLSRHSQELNAVVKGYKGVGLEAALAAGGALTYFTGLLTGVSELCLLELCHRLQLRTHHHHHPITCSCVHL